MSALAEVLRDLVAGLEDETEGWFLFGAQAVALRGAPRATADVDITVRVGQAGWHRLLDSLQHHGIEHRAPERADELVAVARVLPLRHRASKMEVDVVLAGSGLEEIALGRAELIDVAGVEVPVISATDLVVFKVIAGRGKDLDDARSVLARGQVDLPEARALVAEFEQALGVSDLVARFDTLLEALSVPK